MIVSTVSLLIYLNIRLPWFLLMVRWEYILNQSECLFPQEKLTGKSNNVLNSDFFLSIFKNFNMIKMTWYSAKENQYPEPKGLYSEPEDFQKYINKHPLPLRWVLVLPISCPHTHKAQTFILILTGKLVSRVIKSLFLPLDITHFIRHFHAWVLLSIRSFF